MPSLRSKSNALLGLSRVQGAMRIHFGIKHGRNIKWPERCMWCNAKPIKLQEYRKRSIYELKYLIIWMTIRSRKITIYYPVCRKHDLISDLLRLGCLKPSVSHLLHMTFVLGLCGSLCHPCFVKPAPPCEPACSPSYRTSVLFLADM